MKLATHSEREGFVLALAKACPSLTASQSNRLMRLGATHARLQSETGAHYSRKLVRIEDKIRILTRELGITSVFNGNYVYSVGLILPDHSRLNVPTSLCDTQS